jgi:hypothetical protein
MQVASTVRFPEALRLRVPRGLPAAVKAAASRHHTTAPEWVRQVLLRHLETEGLRLSAEGHVEMPAARRPTKPQRDVRP